jgi:hypothetical protein
MPIVQAPFGTQESSDAGWPYRQYTWSNYKLPDPPVYYNDFITPPTRRTPDQDAYTDGRPYTRGRVIRGIDRYSPNESPKIAPLYGIWKDMLFYEYYRRWGPGLGGGQDITPGTGIRVGSSIQAYDLNRIRDLVQTNPPALGTANHFDVRGVQTRAYRQEPSGGYTYFPQAYGYTAGFSGVSLGTYIYAANINSVIDKLIAANNVCVCNCNYCTCNCNYCSCNCNYACTCNCNYSDIRLKTDIEQIGIEHGLKVYTWSYIRDLSKRFSGVMAQDLLGTKYESALSVDSNGYYFVNYSQLPVTFREV